jgi:hypothetical protein
MSSTISDWPAAVAFGTVVFIISAATLLWVLSAIGWIKNVPRLFWWAVAGSESSRPIDIIRIAGLCVGTFTMGVVIVLLMLGIIK